nr:hypothetical protein [Elizabethkingia sp. ASV34]
MVYLYATDVVNYLGPWRPKKKNENNMLRLMFIIYNKSTKYYLNKGG